MTGWRQFDPSTDLFDVLNMKLREADLKEISLSLLDASVKRTLIRSIISSDEVYVMVAENNIIGIFGIKSLDTNIAIPWMVSTDDLLKHQMRFLRGSRDVIRRWLAQWHTLFNAVHSENIVSIKWLKWLGFTVKEDMKFKQKEDSIFYPFYLSMQTE